MTQDVTSTFTVKDTTPPPLPPAGSITATFPDADGYVTITATQGSAEYNGTVLIINDTSGEVVAVKPGTDGSFTGKIAAQLGDEVKIVSIDSSGNQTLITYITFKSSDGRYMVTAKGGIVEGDGGLKLEIPEGALLGPAVIKITPVVEGQLPQDKPVPSGATFLAAFNLDTNGAVFLKAVQISLPAPANVPVDVVPFAARPSEYINTDGVTEKVYEIVDSAKVAAGRLTTACRPFDGILVGGTYVFAYPEVHPVIIQGYLYRDVNKSGMYDTGDIPIRGGVVRSPDAMNYIARTNSDGHYATYSWAISNTGSCRDYRIIAIDAFTQNKQDFASALCEPPYTATKDFIFTSQTAPNTDKEQPRIQVNLTSDQGFVAGTTPVGAIVTINVRISDNLAVDIGRTTLEITGKDGLGQDIFASPPLAAQGTTTEIINGTMRDVLLYQAVYEPVAAGGYSVKIKAADMATIPNYGTRSITFNVMNDTDIPPAVLGPPLVLDGGVYPVPGSTNIMVTTPVQVYFNEPVVNVDNTTFTLKAVSSLIEDPSFTAGAVNGNVIMGFEGGRTKATFIPSGNLRYSTRYEVRLSSAIKDADEGNALTEYVSTFDTKVPDAYGLDQTQFSGRDIDVLGNYAYLAGGDSGWEVVSIADPAHPVVKYSETHTNATRSWNYRSVAAEQDGPSATPDGQPASANIVALTEHITTLSSTVEQYSELRLYDVSNPESPRVVGHERLGEGYTGIPGRLVLSGEYAYICSAGLGLQVVSLPKAIASHINGDAIVGFYDSVNEGYRSPSDIAMLKGKLYVTTTSSHLLVLDAAAPEAPVKINSLDPSATFKASRVAAAGDYNYTDENGTPLTIDIALVASGYGQLYVINITDPYNLQIMATIDNVYASDIVIDKATGRVFLSTLSGVMVLDIKNPSSPQIIANLTDLGTNPAIVVKDGWVYLANQNGGLKTVNFDPAFLKLSCTDPAYPNVKLRCTDYYPALGEKTILIEGRDEAMQLLTSGKLRFVEATPGAPTVTVSSKIIGDTARAPFVNGYAKFYVKTDSNYTGQDIVLSFRVEPAGQQLINTSGGAANTLGITFKVRNNSNVTLQEVLDGEAVFAYDALCNENHKGKTTGSTPDKQQLDFVQKMLNHIIVPLRIYVTQDNMVNTITVDGCYTAETKDALKVIMSGGADPSLTNSSIVVTKVSHHESDANSTKTFDKLDSDYSGLITTDKDKVIDKEILIGLSKKTTDKHPTEDTDVGVLELFENDDWDGDQISNFIEVENAINPLVPNPEYLTPASANNPHVSVERGTYTNGLLHGGLRIPNVNKGYYYFRSGDVADTDNYAALRTLQLIEAVAREWERLHSDLSPLKKDVFATGDNATNLDNNDDDADGHQDANSGTEVRMGIGDMSRQNGGYWSDHASHQNGLDVDIRYVRNNNTEGNVDLSDVGVNGTSALFDRHWTEQLINLFMQHGAIKIFIDPDTGIQKNLPILDWDETGGHSHHIHVRFPIANAPAGIINLHSNAQSLIADGNSTLPVISDPIRDAYGFILVPNLVIRVTASMGTIVEGQNISVDQEGKISFTLRAGTTPGQSVITVRSNQGDAAGTITVDLVQ